MVVNDILCGDALQVLRTLPEHSVDAIVCDPPAGINFMGKAVVINCSSTPTHICYNLGAHKLADWLKEQGHEVACYDGDPGMWELDADLVCLSVIFSWHAPLARQIA